MGPNSALLMWDICCIRLTDGGGYSKRLFENSILDMELHERGRDDAIVDNSIRGLLEICSKQQDQRQYDKITKRVTCYTHTSEANIKGGVSSISTNERKTSTGNAVNSQDFYAYPASKIPTRIVV